MAKGVAFYNDNVATITMLSQLDNSLSFKDTKFKVKYYIMGKNKTGKKKSLSLSTMIALIISGFSILTSVALGTILTTVSVAKMKDVVSKKALELSNTAASMLDGDALKDITINDVNTEAYISAYETLEKFKISNEGTSGELAFIYACRSIGNNEFEFVIDPSDDPAEFGEALEWTEALESANNGVSAFDKEPYTDRWGSFYSAYSPVFDSNHDVVMIVGIDVWADWYNNIVWSNSTSIIIVTCISGASGVLVGVLINIRMRKRFESLSKDYAALESDIQDLISDIKEPIEGKEADSEHTDSNDQLVQLREKIHNTQKEIKEYIIYTKKNAYVDVLSRVGNRAAYLEKIKTLDYSVPFAIIICDINGLKYINDNYGHDNGDHAIIAVSNILQSIFDKDDIYRIGGDEFVVLLTGIDKNTTLDVYHSINVKFFEFNNSKELLFPVNVSKGIAFFDKRIDKSVTDVFNRADEIMYREKEDFYRLNPSLRDKHRR